MNPEIGDRVSKLEGLFGQMALQVKELANNFNSWAKETRDEMRQLSQKMGESHKVNWGVIFGALGIGFGLINTYVRPVQLQSEMNKEERIKTERLSRETHLRLIDYHHDQDKELKSLRERVTRTETIQELILKYEIKPRR